MYTSAAPRNNIQSRKTEHLTCLLRLTETIWQGPMMSPIQNPDHTKAHATVNCGNVAKLTRTHHQWDHTLRNVRNCKRAHGSTEYDGHTRWKHVGKRPPTGIGSSFDMGVEHLKQEPPYEVRCTRKGSQEDKSPTVERQTNNACSYTTRSNLFKKTYDCTE